MSYKVMYRAYRPQTFDEVVGQETVIKTIKNSLAENKISHAYLFCGPRGTGKTTLARLFAKALNCKKEFGTQCNECESCKAIISGEHPDVIEIDAASNSGVDSVRQLIEQVNYQPIMGNYKVYIIDEVHNMSNSAFNALLKTLEEPPEYCVFILATTEPHKVLPTILSRVQRFDFSKVSISDLIRNMENILKKENTSYDLEALKLIASLADGGVRDSLSLLDQVLSFCNEKIVLEDVYKLFGLLTLEEKMKYVTFLHNNDLSSILKKLKNDYENGLDITKLHEDLTKIYKDYLVYYLTNDKNSLSILNKEIILQNPLDLDEINYDLNMLNESKLQYKKVNSIYSHFELTLINIIANKLITNSNQSNYIQKENSEIFNNQIIQTPHEIKVEPKVDEGVIIKKETKSTENVEYPLEFIQILALLTKNVKKVSDEIDRKFINKLSDPLTSYQYDSKLVSILENSHVRICVNNYVIVEISTNESCLYINDHSSALTMLLKDVTNNEFFSFAITSDTFNKLKVEYMNYKNENRIHELDSKLPEKKEKEKTSSDLFVESLFN